LNLKKIIHFSIGPIGAAGLSLITLPFIAWFFTVEDVGRLTMLQVVLSLAVSLFSLAMHQAYVREYNEEDDKPALFKLSILPGLIVLTLVITILLVLPFSISGFLFGIDSGLLTLLLLIGVYASFFINFLTHVLRMQERGLAFSATKIAPKAFLLIFIGFIILLNITAEFKMLMIMNTLSVVVSLFVFSWMTKDTWLISISKAIDKVLLKRMLAFSLPLVAGGIAYWGLTTIDRFFLRNMSSFEELGVYAISVSFAGAVSIVSTIFSNLWHPILYKWAKDEVVQDKIQPVIDNMVVLVALIWSLVGALSFIVPWFLPKEYDAIKYLIVACVSMPLFYMLAQTTGVGIGIKRKSVYGMFASISAFCVNVLLNYLLIPIYGASGAALATLVSFFIFFTVRTEASSKIWHSLPRAKIYIILILYSTSTTCYLLTKGELPYFYLIWGVLFIFTIVLYFQRISEDILIVKKYIKSRC
jgi:O-antigen/teichoic acid export membrane protein